MKQYRVHLFVLCVLVGVMLSGMHHSFQNFLTDMRFGWFPRQATGNIVLVAIDSPSIAKIGVWPWPRQIHAELISKLESAEVRDIVFDVDFSSPSNPVSDASFLDALQKAGGSVVLPTFWQKVINRATEKTIHVNRPLPLFAKQAWSAVVNVAIEPDGLVRRYPYGQTIDGKFLPSVGALLAGKYETIELPLWIDFSIRADTVPTVSYVDLLHGDPAVMQMLKDKRVIVGAVAIELGDRFNVPNGHIIPGSLLQVLAAESILQSRELRRSSNFITLAGVGLIAVLISALRRRLSASSRILFLVTLAGSTEFAGVFLQANRNIMLDTSLFHTAVGAYLIAMALHEIDFRGLLNAVAEKRFQRIAMSLGDGLICTDQKGLITVWNPGATAIFGYEPDDIIGQGFDRVCRSYRDAPPFSVVDLSHEALQVPGGRVMELEGRRKNGEAFPLEACFSGWQGSDAFQYGAIVRDISVRKREEERIRYLAEFDTLTGLANRYTLHEYSCAKLANGKSQQGKVALLLMDLDKFKQINDTLGHAFGDQVLCAVAKQLKELVNGAGLVARLSGDEFAILISGPDVADKAEKLAEITSRTFSKNPLLVGTRELRVKLSIGVAIYPDDCETADELLSNADLALYRAKAEGRGRHAFFERAIRDKLEARLSIEVELIKATEKGEFELFYQPQVSLINRRLVGAEALIRWRHPERGLISPADFMPVVNTSSISDSIAQWVMETACKQGSHWQQTGHKIRLGINLAPSQFQLANLAATVGVTLRNTGFSPALLELEVTENILLEDDAKALEIFRRLQDLGVKIAFDDFGTGYASLTYLKKFPLDRLKIDKSFVRELQANSGDAAIVSSTISLAKQLGLSVIAEGIEDNATANLLTAMGCDEGQGYYFGPPIAAAEFERRFLLNRPGTAVDICAGGPAATAA